MPIKQISAVWLPVTDLDRSVAFYRDSLGLEAVLQEGGWAEVTAGDQTIGLNDAESPAGDGGAVIAFEVDDIEATKSELEGKGVSFTGEIGDFPWGQIVPFKDPDGNDLQLIVRKS